MHYYKSSTSGDPFEGLIWLATLSANYCYPKYLINVVEVTGTIIKSNMEEEVLAIFNKLIIMLANW